MNQDPQKFKRRDLSRNETLEEHKLITSISEDMKKEGLKGGLIGFFATGISLVAVKNTFPLLLSRLKRKHIIGFSLGSIPVFSFLFTIRTGRNHSHHLEYMFYKRRLSSKIDLKEKP